MIRKLCKWLGNIIICFLLLLSVSSLFSIIQAKNSPSQIPSIFGYKMLSVLTGSMEPELKPGDLIIIKNTEARKVKVGDVISFRKDQSIVTHRTIDVNLLEGEITFETKGDANNIKDEGHVSQEQLEGSVLFHIPKAGYLVDFIKSPTGLTILLLIPLLYLTLGVLNKVFADNEKKRGSNLKV